MPVGEAFLSAFLQVLFDRLASREFVGLLQLHGQKHDHDLLEKLKLTLLTVTAVLNDAEEKQFNSQAVEKWLHLAKDALYDAEDVLDDLAIEALKCKCEDQQYRTSANQVRNRLISASFSPFSTSIESKIKKITERLEYVAKYKNVLGLRDYVGGRFPVVEQRLPTTSLVDESCVYGRNDDKVVIVGEILRDEMCSNKVGVVTIAGMCGIGKTTLAQLVYNDERVDSHFDLRVWVCVSDRFDVVRVTKTIIKAVTSRTADFDDLNLLQVALKEKLRGKKFLLVLDDVWKKRNNDWDLLWNPLKAGARGSKIIVTTRDQDVASSMSTVPVHHLGGLSVGDCWSLFVSQAFEHRNEVEHPNLEAIGREIVRKCEGSPLAVKRLGILLRSRQEEYEWKDILNRKIWDLPDDESDILQSLRLSYYHLPSHLKMCFAYCSVFPRDYEFDKDSLVLLWIAEGLVQQPKGNKRLEEIGGKYFEELVSRSFFQQSIRSETHFTMHSLIKDLADFVAGEFCFILEDKGREARQNMVFEKARHFCYIRSNRDLLTKFEAVKGVECLRTFLPLDPTGRVGISYMPNIVPHNLLPKLRYLRSLSFNSCRITELPDSVGELKHLRYLDLSNTAIIKLPDSVSTLYNLQMLILEQCFSLAKLPTGMGNLTCLRHLRISGSRLKEMPLHMCRLKNLQTLSNFVVGKNSGSGIEDLGNMMQLRGALLVSGLQNMASFVDAMDANLKDKQELDQLVLQWSNNFEGPVYDADKEEDNWDDLSIEAIEPRVAELTLQRSFSQDDSRNERVETNVLEMLQPHKNIKQLSIKDYGGTTFPIWIGSPLFSQLVLLKLSNCRRCRCLPSLGQLPLLKDLTVEGMERVAKVGSEFYGGRHSSTQTFPSLEKLKFDRMSKWEEWSPGVEFHNLKKLEISNCPRLKKFSHSFPALTKMSIDQCEELAALHDQFPTAYGNNEQGMEYPCLLELSIRSCPKLVELPNLFPSVEMLEIDGCEDLDELPRLPLIRELELKKCSEELLQSIVGLTSLFYLRLCQIAQLKYLNEGFFKQLTALEELQIAQIGDLVTLSDESGMQNLPYLQRLEISGCPCLKELPQSLYKLSSLKELRVWECPFLVHFPVSGLPSTVSSLEIKDCPGLKLLPEWQNYRNGYEDRKPILLECLVIENCPSLKSLPRGELPDTLKVLQIQNCVNMESLPIKMISNNSSLQVFKFSGCHSVVSFPKVIFQLPAAVTSSAVMMVKQLIISDCLYLVSLPKGLHNLMYLDHLEVADCPLLQSFPTPGLPVSMKSLRISKCENLKALPDQMYSLTSLEELYMEGCSNLMSFPEGGLPTNVVSLTILDCENLRPSYEWGMHRLTSLTDFSFGGCVGLVSFPEEWLLPSSLSCLRLQRLPNLESLPKGLKNLIFGENLEIWECDHLHNLAEDEQPQMLQPLTFWNVL